ncbi:DeoR family transcriptional regulator [Natronococcus wangiae]|uniref:DeoR family transcriptional regulator n=1 Tax=Natronococcus wangiae TaxID=3068275 RepID=UPI00273D307F|nr:DeoR family transcriptional regulator [Natronococcus sp. AD5]
MVADERDGPFEEQYSDDEILAYIAAEEVVTTREVADHFDYHLQTARRRLKRLHVDSQVRKKDVGKRFVWWLPRD